jgi:hypothetical protein
MLGVLRLWCVMLRAMPSPSMFGVLMRLWRAGLQEISYVISLTALPRQVAVLMRCATRLATSRVNSVPILPRQAVVLLWYAALQASTQALAVLVETMLSANSVRALPVPAVGAPRRATLKATSNVKSVSILPRQAVVLLWCAALQTSTQALSVLVETLLSTKSVQALHVLVVMPWLARLQVTSNADSVQALPALMVMLPWWVALQAT